MVGNIKNFLRRNRFLYFLVTYYREKEFRRDYHKYLRRDRSKKSNEEIRHDIKSIRNHWGFQPFYIFYHYYRYKLYEKNLTEDQLLDYIPPFYFYNIYWEKRHPGLDRSLYESKIFQHELFSRLGIPKVDILSIVRKRVMSGLNNEKLILTEFIEKHLTSEDDALFFKPEYGRGGAGIFLLTKKNKILYLNNQPILAEKVLHHLKSNVNYIVQKRLFQSKSFSEINESSVNTLRIYTQDKGGEIIVPACILRMGVNNSFVDNFAQGGLINIIDVETGNLGEYAQTNKVDKKYYEHPDSKYVFKNSKIESWHEIKSLIIKYAALLNECKDPGWDVAITDTGIKILEINVQYGLDIQNIYGGMS